MPAIVVLNIDDSDSTHLAGLGSLLQMSIRATTGLGGDDNEKDEDGGRREQLHLATGWLGKILISM